MVRSDSSEMPEQVLRVAAFVALVLGLWWVRGEELSALDAAWAYGGGMVVGLVFAGAWSRKRTPAPVRAAAPQTPRSKGITRQPCPP